MQFGGVLGFKKYGITGFALILSFIASTVVGCVEPPEDLPTREEGELPLLVILWDPQRSEVTAVPTLAEIEELVFGAAPSVTDFYLNQSRGKYKIVKAGVFGYLADKPADHYWNHPAPGEPGSDEWTSGHYEKWAEAIRKADKDFDYSEYDYNGDGVIAPSELGILVVIPQSRPFGTVRSLLGAQVPENQPLYVDGVKLKRVAEVYTGVERKTKNIPMNFGVTNHELGHLFFGFHDFYSNGTMRPGHYSIMDASYTDAQVDPYHRIHAGWIEPVVITTDGNFHLPSVENSGALIKILRPNHEPPEYFIIENRQHGVYDNDLPDTGLAIWRFVENEEAPEWVKNNIHLIRSPVAIGDHLALWHAPESPIATLSWSDGTPSGIVVSNISVSQEDMTFSLDIPFGAVGKPSQNVSVVQDFMAVEGEWPGCPTYDQLQLEGLLE